jgi:predicted N-formylglutamate amidohydrolase
MIPDVSVLSIDPCNIKIDGKQKVPRIDGYFPTNEAMGWTVKARFPAGRDLHVPVTIFSLTKSYAGAIKQMHSCSCAFFKPRTTQ